MRRLLAARALFAALLGLVTLVTLWPDPEGAERGFELTRLIATILFGDGAHADKIGHFLSYLALGASAAVARLRIWDRFVAVIGALIAYGALLELAQGLGGVRHPDILDAAANAAGALAGGGSLALLIARRAGGARA